MAYHQAVRAIVINDDKLLTMKRNKMGVVYYTLVGGWIEPHEDHEVALRRELREETTMEVGTMRLVFVEDAGGLFGEQYVYLCEYKGGDPVLPPGSDEAKLSASGTNTYEPMWLPLSELPQVSFRSASVCEAVLEGIKHGFPETPQTLAWRGENVAR